MISSSALSFTKLKRLSFVLIAIFLLIACENEIDTSPNILPTSTPVELDMDSSTESDMMVTDGCTSCTEIGTWYRFNKLQLETVDNGPHPVIQVLNSLWTADVDAHALKQSQRICSSSLC